MRKLYGLILLLAIATTYAQAQADFNNQYVITLKGGAYYGGDLSESCGSRLDVNVVYEDGRSVLLFTAKHGGFGMKSFDLRLVFTSASKIAKVVTYSRAFRQGSSLRSCRSRRIGQGEKQFAFNLNNTPCFNATYKGPFVGYDNVNSYITIDVQPMNKNNSTYTIPVKYGPDNTNILPSDQSNRITVLGPTGNAPSFYHWVYSLDGHNWTDLPAQYQGQRRLSISGYDLEGPAFMNNPIANRFIKLLVDCNGGESETLVLAGRISAPNITTVSPMPDRCYAVPWDGAFRIYFARPLFVDAAGNRESINILVRDLATNNANAPDQVLDVTLDEQNSFIFPRRLQSDRQYEVTILTSYLNTFGFSGHPTNHYRSFQLIRPQPVTSTIIPNAVHCHNGSDGLITLSAQGGVSDFRVEYVSPTTGQNVQVYLGSGTPVSITFLPTGTYPMTVYDGNNCSDRDGQKNILVSQPEFPLAIGYSAITDPRGFGYEDGYIETILTGGTPNADKSYAIEWYNPTDLLPATLQNNAPLSQGYQANLDSIGDGFYRLRAYDSQYAVAHPDHRAGCYVESELYHVIQPPPIVVSLSEYHYVTCNGYDDGEILASASGGVPITTGPLPYQYGWLKVENGVDTPITRTDSIATQLRAGQYRIRITDKNNVQKLSTVFTLVQPDVLQAQITGTPISCTAGMDGTASAAVQGGTVPYAYEWSEGSTTPNISGLGAGTYFILVTDVRGCTTTTSGKVGTPFPLQVDSVLRAPQCYGYTNGGIDLTVAAGTAPYRYEWSNGATTQDLDDLKEGTYSVIITDGNDCKNYRSYTLEDPAPVTVELGKDRFLCNEQSYEANAAIGEPAQYLWNGPEGFSATTSNITIRREGTYHVLVTDTHDCKGEDNLVVKKVSLDLNAEFIVSTQAFAAEEVTLLNISSTPSDSVQWWTSAPTTASFTGKASNKAVMVFPSEGAYTLFMKTFRQGCEALFSKTITVLGTSFQTPPQKETSIIQSFTISPNPSQGSFTVKVSLQEAATIRLRLISVGDNRVISELQAQSSNEYELPYSVNLASGTYLLLLESPKGNDMRKVLVY